MNHWSEIYNRCGVPQEPSAADEVEVQIEYVEEEESSSPSPAAPAQAEPAAQEEQVVEEAEEALSRCSLPAGADMGRQTPGDNGGEQLVEQVEDTQLTSFVMDSGFALNGLCTFAGPHCLSSAAADLGLACLD